MPSEKELTEQLLAGLDDATKAKLLMASMRAGNKRVPTAFSDPQKTATELQKAFDHFTSVSYTHLTLPTILRV